MHRARDISVSVDEIQMIPFKGRHGLKCYMMKKPGKKNGVEGLDFQLGGEAMCIALNLWVITPCLIAAQMQERTFTVVHFQTGLGCGPNQIRKTCSGKAPCCSWSNKVCQSVSEEREAMIEWIISPLGTLKLAFLKDANWKSAIENPSLSAESVGLFSCNEGKDGGG
ncbi:hypothetical protein RRG08_039938 [Elysia crispata]|uniref:Uncharacterized protein n=1 Tax=Elysia crispata TaxID=231223 RepID=A0AAE1BBM4_9GAST|nr:hypothetical protein RRG08_039938 [Elysia crispata]